LKYGINGIIVIYEICVLYIRIHYIIHNIQHKDSRNIWAGALFRSEYIILRINRQRFDGRDDNRGREKHGMDDEIWNLISIDCIFPRVVDYDDNDTDHIAR
jgi:hypothetical protein